MTIKLYGTVTSPYVRRARVVARELVAPFEFISTRTPEGQEAQARLAPIGKVPFADFGGEVVFDSHAIVERLVSEHGPAPLRAVAPDARWHESNLLHAIDGILDAGILLFAGGRYGAQTEGVPFFDRERARIQRLARWLEPQVKDGAYLGDEPGLGVTEIALMTTLEWLEFRRPVALEGCPRLEAFAKAHRDRPAFVATRPVEA